MDDRGRRCGALTDVSGSSSTTTAQVAAANPARKYFIFHNADAAIAQWINFGADATAGGGSIKVAAGATFIMDEFVSTDAINVIAASGTPSYTAKVG